MKSNFQLFLVSYAKLGVRKLKSDSDLSKFQEGYVEICLPNFG